MTRRVFPLWVAPVLVAMAIGTVWLRLSIVRTTYAINKAAKDVRALTQKREEMDLKVAGMRSPRRLEVIAREKFGLSQPRSEQVVHVQ